MKTYKQFMLEAQEAIEDLFLSEERDTTFFIYRTDTNAILARNIRGYDAAKEKASAIRRSQKLKFDQVKFRSERMLTKGNASSAANKKGKYSNNAAYRARNVEYANRYNPSKRGRFSSVTYADGSTADLD